jgi:hypothetical protein
VRRGSAVLPSGTEGLGIIAAISSTENAVTVLATIARAGHHPQIVSADVPTGGNEFTRFESDPPSLAEGELRAYEPMTQTALSFAMNEDGTSKLQVLRIHEGPTHLLSLESLGEIALRGERVWAVASGVSLPGRASFFAFNEFEPVAQGTAPCIPIDEARCVAPGPIRMVVVDGNSVRVSEAASQGMVDSFGLESDGSLLVIYVAPGMNSYEQRAVRYHPENGQSTALEFRVPPDLPAIDQPSLVHCGGETWMVAKVFVGATDGRPGEPAVTAFPTSCVIRPGRSMGRAE